MSYRLSESGYAQGTAAPLASVAREGVLVVSSATREATALARALAGREFEVETVGDLPAALVRLHARSWAALLLHLPASAEDLASTLETLQRIAPALAVVVHGFDGVEHLSHGILARGAQACTCASDVSHGHLPRILHEAIVRARFRATLDAPARLARDVLTAITDAVLSMDRLGNVTYLNPVAETLTGWTLREAVGRGATEVLVVVDERTRRRTPDLLHRAMLEERSVEPLPGTVLINRHGHEYFIDESAAPIRDPRGMVVGAVSLFRDAGRQRAAARHLAHRAHHDALTDLPNRVLLAERVNNAFVLARRHGRMVALLYVDLDGFKSINDTYGHTVGDQLLVSTAQRMRDGVRASDTVSRQGGDEFVILLSEVACVADAEGSAQKLLVNLARAHRLGRRRLRVSASIGISLYPAHGTTFAALLLRADAAMYAAKRAGGNTARLADPGVETLCPIDTPVNDA